MKQLTIIVFLMCFLVAPAFATTPYVVQRQIHPNTATLASTNGIAYVMPQPAAGGETAVCVITTNNNPITNITCTDDKSDTCTQGPNVFSGSITAAIFTCANITAGAQTFNDNQSTGGLLNQFYVFFVNNVATTSPVDGAGCTGAVTSGTSIPCSGSFTTSNSGDIIIYCSFVVSFSSKPTGPVSFTGQGGAWGLLAVDDMSWSVCQSEIQASAGAVTRSMSASQAVTQANSVAIALKAGSGGSPVSGIFANGAQLYNVIGPLSNTPTGTAVTLQFPCTGNFIAIALENGVDATSIVDSNSTTFTAQGSFHLNATSGAGERWYTASVTCGPTYSVTITMRSATWSRFGFVDVSNTGGFDVESGGTGNQAVQQGGNLAVRSITPTTSNGLILGFQNQLNNTVSSVLTGVGLQANLNPAAVQFSQFEEDGGFLLYKNPNTSAFTPTYVLTNTQSTFNGQWEAATIALKAPSGCSQFIALVGIGCK